MPEEPIRDRALHFTAIQYAADFRQISKGRHNARTVVAEEALEKGDDHAGENHNQRKKQQRPQAILEPASRLLYGGLGFGRGHGLIADC